GSFFRLGCPSPYFRPQALCIRELLRTTLPLDRQHRIERRWRAGAAHVAKADLREERLVLVERPLLPFGAREHVEILHLRPRRAALVVQEQLLGDQDRPARWQPLVDPSDELEDLLLSPIVENPP